jgi:glycosyltransferase involved in cell wall biosynthesis
VPGGVHVLYVVYWGALEPLGRALVLPAVTRLASLGAELTLVTYDKPADLERAAEVDEVRRMLHDAAVRWVPLRYHKQPRIPATLFDAAYGVARGAASGRADVVHARTFIGGLTGLPLARVKRAKLIYHNEGFYPDEQVDGGFWEEGSRPHRIAKSLERRLYGSADAIFSLSEKGREIIGALDEVAARGTPIEVVPSSVDLDHFVAPGNTERNADAPRLVYMGSVGGRYLVDRIGRFAAVAGARLEILTPADTALVASELGKGGLPHEAWSSRFVPYEQLPGALAAYDAGVCFHTHTLSAAGGSSTKVGQYWAVGLPVIATAGLGDVDDIVRRERVGVVVGDHSDSAYEAAVDELRSLLRDPELAARCRAAAERHYGLDDACRRQLAIYERLARSS